MAVTRILRQEGRRAIAVDGVVQSIEVVPGEPTPGYWPAMLPGIVDGRVLMLGFGGGTIARLLLDASETVQILAIDDDPTVLNLARRSPRFRIDDPRLELIEGDAFASARDLETAGRRFDLIVVDLYRAAEMLRAALGRPFLRRLRALLEPDGCVSINIIRDRRTARRLRRIGQHLTIAETRLIGLNCVVLCIAPRD